MSNAVREVFVRLYDEGWIYRGTRIVNWCPKDKTVLSDLEVKEEKVVMAYVMDEGDADYPEKLESTKDNKVHLFVLKKAE